MKRLPWWITLIGLTFGLLQTGSAWAYIGLCCAKCGGNMPMNIPGGGVPETYEYRLKVSPMLMRMEGLRDGTDEISPADILGDPNAGLFMAVPTEMDMTMFNLALGYSFTDDLFGGVMLMYADKSMDMRFNTTMQGMTGQSGFTMESSGLADTMLMGKYRLSTDDPLIPTRQFSLLFALNLPTGSIDEKNSNHPLAIRQGEQLPYGMQLGSGTFDPTVGVLYQGSRSPYWWGANASYTARLYDNDRDYHLGDEARLDLYGMFQFRHDLLAQLQLNIAHTGSIDGEMDEAVTGASGHAAPGNPSSAYMTPLWDPDNYGGTTAMATVGLQWQPAQMQIVDLSLGVPLYRDLNGPQLEEDYRVMLTWYKEIPTADSVRFTGRPKGESALGF